MVKTTKNGRGGAKTPAREDRRRFFQAKQYIFSVSIGENCQIRSKKGGFWGGCFSGSASKKRNAGNNGFQSRSRSEHIECEFTSIYRTRVYERISNRAERDISSRAAARHSTDSLATSTPHRLRRSRYCARRGIAQFDMCFALDMPREHGSICRLRDKSQRKRRFSPSRARRRRIR